MSQTFALWEFKTTTMHDAAKRACSVLTAAHGIKRSIMKHVADNKVAYKKLAACSLMQVVPKNLSGKLLRCVLRDKAREMRSRPAAKL
ncbi:hypothetical protein BDN67DRAFT_1009057 [Paxillus ammoniavirescens]|nr:hypothetical protein BDN67DRAFT_1009057 [Paxillus ammoniavirescens]